MREPEVRRVIAEYYYDKEAFTEAELELFPPFESVTELEKLKFEREEQKQDRQFRLQKLEMKDTENRRLFESERMRLSSAPSPTTSNDKFIASREVRLVPPFDKSRSTSTSSILRR